MQFGLSSNLSPPPTVICLASPPLPTLKPILSTSLRHPHLNVHPHSFIAQVSTVSSSTSSASSSSTVPFSFHRFLWRLTLPRFLSRRPLPVFSSAPISFRVLCHSSPFVPSSVPSSDHLHLHHLFHSFFFLLLFFHLYFLLPPVSLLYFVTFLPPVPHCLSISVSASTLLLFSNSSSCLSLFFHLYSPNNLSFHS